MEFSGCWMRGIGGGISIAEGSLGGANEPQGSMLVGDGAGVGVYVATGGEVAVGKMGIKGVGVSDANGSAVTRGAPTPTAPGNMAPMELQALTTPSKSSKIVSGEHLESLLSAL